METGVGQERGAVGDLASLSVLYPPHHASGASGIAGENGPSRRSLLERSLRRDIARHVLDEQLPDLLAELVEAAADDLSVPARTDTLTDAEAQSDAELRIIEAVEHAKAVLDAAGLQALARLRSCIESTELARAADLGARTPAGWLDADRLTMLEVTTATGLPDAYATSRRHY